MKHHLWGVVALALFAGDATAQDFVYRFQQLNCPPVDAEACKWRDSKEEACSLNGPAYTAWLCRAGPPYQPGSYCADTHTWKTKVVGTSLRCSDRGGTGSEYHSFSFGQTAKPCPAKLSLTATGNTVKPGNSISGFVAQVVNCSNQPVNGVKIEIIDSVEAQSGWHSHGPDDDQRRLGSYQGDVNVSCAAGSGPGKMVCTTGSDGKIEFDYLAPSVAGTHQLAASCVGVTCNLPPSVELDVLIQDLVAIEAPPASAAQYLYIGEPKSQAQKDIHPYRHYLQQDALDILEEIGWAYSERVEEPLCINDASLPWGGIFDLGGLWQGPHATHSCGKGVDIAGNANGANHSYTCEVRGKTVSGRDRMFEFSDVLRLLGVPYEASETSHYHLYLMPGGRLPCN